MSLPPPDLPPDSEPSKKAADLPAPSEPTAEAAPEQPTAPNSEKGDQGTKPTREDDLTPNLPDEAAAGPTHSFDAESALAMILGAFRYPLEGKGLAGLTPLAVLAVVMGLGGKIPFLSFVVVFLTAGYAVAYMLRVIETTVKGDEQLPGWLDVTNLLDDIVLPAFQIWVVVMLSNLVAIVLGWMGFGATPENPGYRFADFLGMASFALYYPMAVLALAHFGSLRWTLPDRVIPAIQRALPGYWIAVGIVFLCQFVVVFVGDFTAQIPLLGSILNSAIMLFLMVVTARILGLVFLKYRKAIAW